MPRTCIICRHDRLDDIDKALVIAVERHRAENVIPRYFELFEGLIR